MHATTSRPTVPEPTIHELLATQRHRDALAALDGLGAAADADARSRLWRAEALRGLECWQAAATISEGVLGDAAAAPLLRGRARLLLAQRWLAQSPRVDDALELLAEAIQIAHAPARERDGDARDLLGHAHLAAAHGWTRKGCAQLASRALASARELFGDDGRVAATTGRMLLAFDDRLGARRQFELAAGASGPGRRWGALGLAAVAALAGEFAAAHAHLDTAGLAGPDDRDARRLRLRVLLAEGRWDHVVAAIDELLAASPRADTAPGDRHVRANALYHAGRRAEAVQGWRELATAGGESAFVQRARRDLHRLTRAEAATAAVHRLPAFPSVAQLRDHCGPASIELFLRYFGMPADQVEVARAIKHPTGGTPLYRMRQYLEAAGFVARRIAADLPELRRLLRAGLPVILEEDLSEGRHAVVAIGFDDAREILLLQDPLTHETRETPYEDLPRLRELCNHGALLAVPARDAARLDELGVAEAREIALVDEAWARRDAGDADSGDRLARDAIALRPDHEPAWLYRFHHLLARATPLPPEAPERAELRALVADIAARWPDDEWPQQLLAQVHALDRELPRALAAHERARDRDPNDARNWVALAMCHTAAGQDEPAHDAWAAVLLRNPGHPRANAAMALHQLRRGRLLRAWLANEAARERAPGDPLAHHVHAQLLAARGDAAGALAANARAIDLAPDHLPLHGERARLLARNGRVDDALAGLQRAIASRPGEVALLLELAELAVLHGRAAIALGAATALRERSPADPVAAALLGAALGASGRVDEGVAELQRALAARPQFVFALQQLGRLLARAGRPEAALTPLAAAAGLAPAPTHALDLAEALVALRQPADAARGVRAALAPQRLTVDEWDRAAALLLHCEGVRAAHRALDELGNRAPDDLALARAHVHLLTERTWAPGLVREPARRLVALAPDDPAALAVRGASGPVAGEAAAAHDALLRRALELAPGRVAPRRFLAQRLLQRGLAGEALALLPEPARAPVDLELRVEALLALGRDADAAAAIATAAAGLPAGEPPLVLRALQYRLARHRADWTAALALATSISRDAHEQDDGRLDAWEEARFECLLRLGETERAHAFGLRQCGDAASAARLAQVASRCGAAELAARFTALVDAAGAGLPFAP